ncbi:MAG: hypothetical protein J7K84_07885 [Deltaproteobacteria bacterium]|nr:hypothetical protein [Deltaproteobacteria bacterium]
MLNILPKEIRLVREKYRLSMAQFGTMVGAPATSVKRWEEDVKPQERFFFQIILVLGLIENPDEIFFDLGRQGIKLNKKHWDGFANLVKGASNSLAVAKEAGLPEPEINSALVSGINGLLALITGAFAAKNSLGTRIYPALASKIANLLK